MAFTVGTYGRWNDPEIIFECKLPRQAAESKYVDYVYEVEWYKNNSRVHEEHNVTFPAGTTADKYLFQMHERHWYDTKINYGQLGHQVYE